MCDRPSRHPEGPVAVVTGATGMIGPAICETLEREGWRVAACASSEGSFGFNKEQAVAQWLAERGIRT